MSVYCQCRRIDEREYECIGQGGEEGGVSEEEIHLYLLKLVLYLNHYLINSKFEAADEMMTKVQHQFQEIKMDFKTRNSSKKRYTLKNLC